MAIVKMKKLRLMAIRSETDQLLRELERFGCVEFSELDEALTEEGLVHESADVISDWSSRPLCPGEKAAAECQAPGGDGNAPG